MHTATPPTTHAHSIKGTRRTVDVITMGCSKNLVDSERLLRQLQHSGVRVFHDPPRTHGDVAVVNTCGFIGDAKQESINMILSLLDLKERGRLRRVYVMGCLAERYRADLEKELPGVDGYYGKFDWPQLLSDLSLAYDESIAHERLLTTPPHYAYLKISEGCDRRCAYCAIPIITGRHRSRPMDELVAETKQLVAGGVSELQVIAQELTAYGTDLYHRQALPELVDRLADVPGVEWIRLHYAYPAHFPLELIDVMARRPNVCHYLDIALQHINDDVLRRMRRATTRRETLELIGRLRQAVPDIALRTTLMVGFPGETDEAFEELLDFVREVRFERMGAFAYSEEEGTYAAEHYADDVPPEVKQEHLDRLMALQQEVSAQVSASRVGQRLRVVVDRVEEEYYVGRTAYDSPEVDGEVYVSRSDAQLRPGQYCEVEITGADDYDLYGHVASEPQANHQP